MKNALFLILSIFISSLSFTQNCPQIKESGTHFVQKGETLYAISRQYKVEVEDLYEWNRLSEKSILNICQEIIVKSETDKKSEFTEKKAVAAYTKQKGDWHIVQAGERIEKIADLYGYTLWKFRKMNEMLPGERIFIGMKLVSSDCICPETNQKVREKMPEKKQSLTNGETATRSGSKVLKFNADNSDIAEETEKLSPNIDLPSNLNFLKDEEKQMIAEINLVRSNPAGYIPFIEEYKKELRTHSNYGTAVQAANELIEELRSTSRLSQLSPIECLYEAAKKHGEDLRKAGKNDHVGTDGSWPWDRVERECPLTEKGNENLVGGPESVRKAVILLLVDNGISSRGHRKTLLNPKWQYIACYKIGKVGYMPNSWVQKFAY